LTYLSKRLLRLMPIILIVAAISGMYILKPESFRIIHLLARGDIHGSIEFIKSYGPYAMVVSFLLIVFINIVAVLPNIFILAANGIIFGVVKGTLISWLAESIGVVISFILMRYLFRDYAHEVILRSNALKKIDEFSGSRGLRIMLIARSIPYIPSGLVTALGALSSIQLKDYIIATFIGKLLSAGIEVTLGHDLVFYKDHIPRLIFLVLLSGVAYYFFLHYKKGTEQENKERKK
jgi:uncharacterized membrane protein YdjX (TVP38/TMEM64 family)